MAQKKITDLTLRSSFDETVNLPGDDTSQTWRVTGQQILDFISSKKHMFSQIENLTIATSVNASALTVAIKTKAGTDPSSTDYIKVGMRSPTLTSGSYNQRTISGALSMTVSSGSTLGQTDGQPSRIYVYLIDNSGTLELAVSHKYYPEDALVTTTAEGGAGGADSATAIYSTSARSSVASRLIGYIDNTQSTAGTWASAGTQIQLMPCQNFKTPTVQKFTSGSGTYYKPAGCKLIRVRMVGGGGGGGGSSNNGSGGTGGTGGSTTFGSSLLTCAGGSGGQQTSAVGGAGGAATLNSPAIGTALTGSAGNNNTVGHTGYAALAVGGVTPFGGNSAANTGSGGSGNGGPSAGNAAGAGGAGAFIDALIADPLSSYAYAVGAAGTAGSAGTGGAAGGAGAAGYIEVTEYYN